MAVKLGSILERQLKKLGVELNDDVKALLELDTEVNDEIASKFDKGLLTIEAAKTNPDVNKALRQSILGVADTKMDELIKDLGVIVGDDFVNEKNTYEKLNLLSKYLVETGRKKAEADGKANVSETLKKEREAAAAAQAELQNKLKELTESLSVKETEFQTTRENDIRSFELYKILMGKDYAFPKEMDTNLKVAAAEIAINNDLASKGLIAKFEKGKGFTITDKEGNRAYTDKHEAIDNANSYFDGVLSQNKLLQINDPNTQKQNNGAGGSHIPTNNKGNLQIAAEIEQQLAELQ